MSDLDIPIVATVVGLCVLGAALLAVSLFGILSRILGGTATLDDVLFGGIIAGLLGEGVWALAILRPWRRSP